MTAITINDLTTGKIDGTGIFDRLMIATKAHLDFEFKRGSIKGAEYAQVYLGQVQSVLSTAQQFLFAAQKSDLEQQLLQQQVLLAKSQIDQVNAQTALTNSQKAVADQQALNLVKEGAKTDVEILQTKAQTNLINSQKAVADQQALNLVKEGAKTDVEILQTKAQTDLIGQQMANLVLEAENLKAQKCLLQAQYDNMVATTLRVGKETDLTAQKVVTEKAQTMSSGVDVDSVVGRQKALYQAQTSGFQRDAEQKAASTLLQTWSTQRMTDEGVSANADNMLNDAALGRVVNKLLAGINA